MMDFIRSLCMTISAAFLKFIPKLYALFYDFAVEPTFFNTDDIQRLTNNIYVLISVVMLFALASKALAAIVNPDNLWDTKKGVAGVIKRAIIALALLVVIPFGFKYFYEFQTQIISKGLIEKVILGIDFDGNITEEQFKSAVDNVLKDSELDITIDDLIKVIDPDKKKGITATNFDQLYSSANSYEKMQLRAYILDASRLSAKWQIGQALAAEVLYDTLRPNSTDGTCDSGIGIGIHPLKLIIDVQTLGFNEILTSLTGIGTHAINITDNSTICDVYQKTLNENIEYVDYLANGINATTGVTVGGGEWFDNKEKYVFQFDYWGLLCLVISGVVVYMLIMFVIDSAVRLIKMAFLEITAPVSVMAYIFGGSDYLKKWFNELLSTALGFFLRVAAIAFLALVLENLDNFVSNIPKTYGFTARLFMLIGALIFAKKVPEIIEKLTGVKLNLQGGIGGRLGQMAGVGKVAQNAWKGLGNVAKGAATLPLIGAGLGAKAVDKYALNGKGSELVDKLKNSKAVGAASALGALAKNGGGIKGLKAASEAYNKNPSASNSSYISEENRKKQQADAIKNKISAKGEKLGLYGQADPSTGERKINTNAIKSLNDNQYKDVTNRFINDSGDKLIPFQKQKLVDQQNAQLEYNNAKDKADGVNNLIEYLNRVKTSTTNADAKQRIQKLSDNLTTANAGTVNSVENELRQLQNLTSLSSFTKDASNQIINGLTSATTANDYNSVLSELNTQLSGITDVNNKSSIQNIISDISKKRDSLVLDSAMNDIKSNLSINTTDSINTAISQLKAQADLISDATIKNSINQMINQIETRQTPGVTPDIINDLDRINSSIKSSVSPLDLNVITTEINNVQASEASGKSVISDVMLTQYISDLQNSGEFDSSTGDYVLNKSKEELDKATEKAKEKLEKADKDVDDAKEKATTDQKNIINGIQKELKKLNDERNDK